ncbi:PucR family transcriptional regulator [Bacillus sp. 1P06AnD]|uniref:PucR family transcriptional regulator n=1 Tax=Bacillus sp. 1P06AnD TaxID=3132208 RepID=UPI00399F3B9E
MREHFKLSVADVLERKHFKNAKVIAGMAGVHRIVKWVHVMETASVRNLLHGNELILTTGLAFKEEPHLFFSMIKELIDHGAAGVCLELGTYITSIPEGIIQYADLHRFPLIVFDQEVLFVDITQDIHSIMINQQYEMISNLEEYSQMLNKKILSIEHYEEILQYIFAKLDVQIIFKRKDSDFEFVPDVNHNDRIKLLTTVLDAKDHYISAPIHLFDQEYATIALYSKDIPLGEYEILLLDRTSTALAHHFQRELFIAEKKKAIEHEVLTDWLEGRNSIDDVCLFLNEQGVQSDFFEAVVLIAKYNAYKNSHDVTYLKLLFRSFFEQNGFLPFSIEKKNEIIFILINNRKKEKMKVRLNKAIECIHLSDFGQKLQSSNLLMGAGKFITSLKDLNRSYESAKETLYIHQKMPGKKMPHCYEDLHLYRLIHVMNKQVDLTELLNDYLKPILEYDQQYNGCLLETLKVYLECNGSKQDTSKRLFIVRQTLYHRLQKIENLIGSDFMEQEKRVALELMLFVYDYLDVPSHVKAYEM